MTDRQTPAPDNSGPSSSDYEAPSLYESSDLLAKYRAPAPDAPGFDPTSDAVDEVVASAASSRPASPSDAPSDYSISFNDATATTSARRDAASALSVDALETLDGIEAERNREDEAAHRDHPGAAGDGSSRAGASEMPPAVAARQSLLGDVATVANTIGHRGASVGAGPAERVGDTTHRYSIATRQRQAPRGSGVAAGGGAAATGMRPTLPAPGGSQPASASAATQKPKKKSNVAIYFGIAAVVAAFIGWPWFVWPVALVLITVAIFNLRATSDNRVRGAFTLALALVALVVQFINPIGAIVGGDGATASGPSEGAISVTGTSSVSGSGNARIDVALPDGPTVPAILEVSNTGGEFRVYEIDIDGEEFYSSAYSAYRESTGLAVLNGDPLRTTAGLSIEAEGPWTVTLKSVESLPAFDAGYAGEGDAIFLYTGAAGDAAITMTPDDSLSVTTHGTDDWNVHVDGLSSMSRPWPAGPVVIEIEAYDSWSIAVTPVGAVPPGPAPDDAAVPEEGAPDDAAAVPEEVTPVDAAPGNAPADAAPVDAEA